MAVSKVVLNGRTLIDVTQDTVASTNLLTGNTATKNDGTKVNGAYTAPTIESLSVTVNGTYTAPSGGAYNPVTVNVEGGGGSSAEEKQVNFIDYDGTILYSYTAAEANALTELPANPTHNGLTAQGWNWTLAQIKAQLTAMPDDPVWVGQMYITTSGATEIDIELDSPEYLSPYLAIAVNGSVTVNWGDGSSTDIVTGNSLTTLKYQNHVYAQIGNYTISIAVNSGSVAFYTDSSTKASVLSAYDSNSNRRHNPTYAETIRHIRVGASTSIGASAFQNCHALQSLTIPDDITSIENYAFQYCYALQSLTIPDGVTSIGTGAFQNCYALQNLTIPDGITSIGNSAFVSCYALQSLTISAGITSIGTTAFQNCYALQSLTIPDGVTSIGNSAFVYCCALQSLTIPDSVTSIGSNAFQNCRTLQSLTIPDDITSIGNGTFQYCYALQSLTIPDGITSIGTSAFGYCNALQSLTIPDGVTSIGASTFQNCYALQSLTIPDGVTSIGNLAFQYCYAIKEYHFLPTTPPTLSNINAFNGIVSDTIIYVPYSEDHSILDAYKTATNWSSYANYMQEEPQ